METITTDIAIVGAGGAGLRAAIAVAEADPSLRIALISKVYPMRSHTVAAEGGAAGVIKPDDKLEYHFHDTVAGGDWLTDQDVVQYFVETIPKELTLLEHWGCPWSREPNGKVAVRPFGGMKIMRTWFAADKTGFHMLHTLFQTSIKYPSIQRFDEYYSTDLMVEDGRCTGVTAIEMRTGVMKLFNAKAVIICSGGAGKIFPFTTNGGIKTGDGMSMCYRVGVPLKDMEFVQYHPTGLPITGILLTEGCRGEGGYLVNKDGYRYLQDYDLGKPTEKPVLKSMELGPRDRLSQAWWHEQRKGRTIKTPHGDMVHLDLRHLGEKKLNERLPMVLDLSRSYIGVDPVTQLVPVRPVVHYMMGGIHTNIDAETPVKGLYAVGECACASLNGANRLGSNSLGELLVFGARAGKNAVTYIKGEGGDLRASATAKLAAASKDRVDTIFQRANGTETVAGLRKEMNDTLEEGAGIYRTEAELQDSVKKIDDVRARFTQVSFKDKSSVFNTDLIYALELGSMLDCAQALVHGALNRKESRGSHQRLDYEKRDDVNFLKHTMVYHTGIGAPKVDYLDVTITTDKPAERVYGRES
ncbi:MAG: fumarate reductase (quinol) flavoprotein subunit [Alphaproteobacteria bacterium]